MNPSSRRLVWLLSATATASYLCRVNASIAGALLMRDFGLSQVEMGRVFSAFLLGYALCQIPGGALADRWGARRVLMVSAWWWVIVTWLQAMVGSTFLPVPAGAAVGALLVLRFLLGVGEAPTFPAAAQGVSRWVPPAARGSANGMVVAAIGLGSAIAPPLVSAVMVRSGWRVAMAVSAMPSLVVALLWRAIPSPVDVFGSSADSASQRRGAGAPRRFRDLTFLTLSYTLQGYVGYIFVFWFYLYLVQVRHFDLLRGAIVSSLPWILSIVSIPLGGAVSDWLVAGRPGPVWGRRIVPLVGLVGSGVFISVGARAVSPYLAAGYLAVATALVLSVEGPFWATMTELAGPKTGLAGGVMNMGSNLGGFISPMLTPVLATRIGWEGALDVAAAISVLGGVLWLGISPMLETAIVQGRGVRKD